MHYRALLDSEVVRFVDLIDKGDVTVKIKSVKKGKVTGSGGKASSKGLITFENAEKPLAAGATILASIAQLYGADTRAWVSKWITLYADPNVSFGGVKCGGVRVRPIVPKEPAPAKDKEPSNG